MSGKPKRDVYDRTEAKSQEFQLETRHLALLILIVVVLCLGSFQLGRWVERQSGGGSFAASGAGLDDAASDGTIDDMGDVSKELTFFDSLKEDTVVDDAPVRARPESTASAAPTGRRSVNEGIMIQVFASRDRSAAQAVRNRLREKGYTAFILTSDGTHKVRVGPYADKEEAELQAAIIREREDLHTWIP